MNQEKLKKWVCYSAEATTYGNDTYWRRTMMHWGRTGAPQLPTINLFSSLLSRANV